MPMGWFAAMLFAAGMFAGVLMTLSFTTQPTTRIRIALWVGAFWTFTMAGAIHAIMYGFAFSR